MLRNDFIQLLKKHDWYYQYSDDPRAYRKGREERFVIERMVSAQPEFVELYHLHGKSLNH